MSKGIHYREKNAFVYIYKLFHILLKIYKLLSYVRLNLQWKSAFSGSTWKQTSGDTKKEGKNMCSLSIF